MLWGNGERNTKPGQGLVHPGFSYDQNEPVTTEKNCKDEKKRNLKPVGGNQDLDPEKEKSDAHQDQCKPPDPPKKQ